MLFGKGYYVFGLSLIIWVFLFIFNRLVKEEKVMVNVEKGDLM